MKAEFRNMNENDLQSVIELCNECFDESTNLNYALSIYKKNIVDENTIQIVGEYEGKIIAYSRLAIIPTIFEDMNTYAIINHFCVKPEYRRNNIATNMLEEIMKICSDRKVKTIKLWSKNFRIPAHNCYKKYGFEMLDATFFEKKVEDN